MNETSQKLEEKRPKFISMGNGDQKIQATRKEEPILEVLDIDENSGDQ